METKLIMLKIYYYICCPPYQAIPVRGSLVYRFVDFLSEGDNFESQDFYAPFSFPTAWVPLTVGGMCQPL